MPCISTDLRSRCSFFFWEKYKSGVWKIDEKSTEQTTVSHCAFWEFWFSKITPAVSTSDVGQVSGVTIITCWQGINLTHRARGLKKHQQTNIKRSLKIPQKSKYSDFLFRNPPMCNGLVSQLRRYTYKGLLLLL